MLKFYIAVLQVLLEDKFLAFVKGSSIVDLCTGIERPLNVGTPKQKMEQKICRVQERGESGESLCFQKYFRAFWERRSPKYARGGLLHQKVVFLL